MSSKRPYVLAVLVVLAAFPVCGKKRQDTKLELEIHKVTETKFGYEVSIRVKNISPNAIALARTEAAPSLLQSLDVQQWDEELGWQSVGPCRDVAPWRVIFISPKQQIEDVVLIGDLEHGWSSAVCPRRIKQLGGKIRAVVYCMYNSEHEYKNRMHCSDCCTPNTSPIFNLPPLTK